MSNPSQEPILFTDYEVEDDATALQQAAREREIDDLVNKTGWSVSAVIPLARHQETSAEIAARWKKIAQANILPMIDNGAKNPPEVA